MHDLGEGTFRFTRVSYDPSSNLPYLRVMDDGGKVLAYAAARRIYSVV